MVIEAIGVQAQNLPDIVAIWQRVFLSVLKRVHKALKMGRLEKPGSGFNDPGMNPNVEHGDTSESIGSLR